MHTINPKQQRNIWKISSPESSRTTAKLKGVDENFHCMVLHLIVIKIFLQVLNRKLKLKTEFKIQLWKLVNGVATSKL